MVLISLEITLTTAAAAAVAASAAGLTVVVNPAPPGVLAEGFLRVCDVLVPNEHEVALLDSRTSSRCSPPESARS